MIVSSFYPFYFPVHVHVGHPFSYFIYFLRRGSNTFSTKIYVAQKDIWKHVVLHIF